MSDAQPPTIASTRLVRPPRQARHRASGLPGRRADGIRSHPDRHTRCGVDPKAQLIRGRHAAVDLDPPKRGWSTLRRAGRAVASIGRRPRLITGGGR